MVVHIILVGKKSKSNERSNIIEKKDWRKVSVYYSLYVVVTGRNLGYYVIMPMVRDTALPGI